MTQKTRIELDDMQYKMVLLEERVKTIKSILDDHTELITEVQNDVNTIIEHLKSMEGA